MALTDAHYESYWHQYFQEMEDDFLSKTQEFDEGNISAIDLAVQFTLERKELERLDNQRKEWLSENVDSIINEAEQWGKEGYKGFRFSNSSRPQYSFDTNPQYVQLKSELKAIEDKMKAAYMNLNKGLMNVSSEGEEIPLPKVTYTKPSVKAEIIKR